MLRESEIVVKNDTYITSRINRCECECDIIRLINGRTSGLLSFECCCGRLMMRISVLDGFRERKLDDIKLYTFDIVFPR